MRWITDVSIVKKKQVMGPDSVRKINAKLGSAHIWVNDQIKTKLHIHVV